MFLIRGLLTLVTFERLRNFLSRYNKSHVRGSVKQRIYSEQEQEVGSNYNANFHVATVKSL